MSLLRRVVGIGLRSIRGAAAMALAAAAVLAVVALIVGGTTGTALGAVAVAVACGAVLIRFDRQHRRLLAERDRQRRAIDELNQRLDVTDALLRSAGARLEHVDERLYAAERSLQQGLGQRKSEHAALRDEFEEARTELRRSVTRLRTIDERQAADLVDVGQRLDEERDARVIGDAAALDRGRPTSTLVLVTIHRSASTQLFDLLRRHPEVYVEPFARTWRTLGLESRRYPMDLSDGTDPKLSVEVLPGRGAMLPAVDDRPTPWQGRVAVEKLHPEFFDFDTKAFAERLAALEQSGTEVRLVLQARAPLASMWSMVEYKRRNPQWYTHLTEDEVPAFIERSLRSLVELRRTTETAYVDYDDVVSVGPRFRQLYSSLPGGLAVPDSLSRRIAERGDVTRASTDFTGPQSTDRTPDGPDGIWVPHRELIEEAEQHYRELTTGPEVVDSSTAAS